MPADHNVVRDLNEIVDLDSFLNPGSSEARAVDSRVRTDLDIVIDLDNPELRDFSWRFSTNSNPKPSAPITAPLG